MKEFNSKRKTKRISSSVRISSEVPNELYRDDSSVIPITHEE